MKSTNNKITKASQFFGVNKSMMSMLFMVILLGLGEKMGERFLPIYLLAIGGSAYSVGLLNALDNFLSAIYSFIGGLSRIRRRLLQSHRRYSKYFQECQGN